MSSLNRLLLVFTCAFFVQFVPQKAHSQIIVGGGYSWLRGSGLQNGAQQVPFVEAELGIPKGNASYGLFGVANFARDTSGASFTPLFYGIFGRVFMGSKGKKGAWVDFKLDVISLVYLFLRSSSSGSTSTSFFDFVSYGVNFGFHIQVGKRFAIMPYAGFRSFNYPYLGVASYNYPRYYSPEVGLKIALE